MANAIWETIIIEVDSDLLREVEEILMPYGLPPEDAAVLFLKFCVHPATKEKAASMILEWQAEQNGGNHGGVHLYTKGR